MGYKRRMNNIAELVKQRREELGISQEKLAEAVGTSQATIDKIENQRSRQSRFLPQIFRVLQLPLELLTVSRAMPVIPDVIVTDDQGRVSHVELKHNATGKVHGTQLVGEADLPIYSAVRGGSFTDSVLVSPEAIDYVKRPEPLAKARNGYGIYVVGDSMEPAFRQGDLALVHPNLPPKPGDEVVICSLDGNGEFYAVIKQLVRVTADNWVLRQYNPQPGEPAEFSLDRKEWPTCHLVVGNYRRR